MAIDVQPVAGALGAEVHGLDLAGDIGDAGVDAIWTELRAHKVLFFPDQDLDADQHVALGRRFGDLEAFLSEGTADSDGGDADKGGCLLQ